MGAESPDEVAISVAAELVAIRRGRPRPSDGSMTSTATRSPSAPTVIDLPGAHPRPAGQLDEGDGPGKAPRPELGQEMSR